MSNPKTSITYTLAALFGMAVAAVGTVLTVLGIGGVAEFKLSVAGLELSANHVGIITLFVGLIFTAAVLFKKPDGVALLSRSHNGVGAR